MVHGAHREQAGDRDVMSAHPAIGDDDDAVALVDRA